MPVSRPIADRCADLIHPEPNSGCWLWIGCINANGYALVSVQNRSKLAHRVIYGLVGRTVPDGLDLDHLCRVRSCVNPDHLEPVTRSENVRRGLAGAVLAKYVAEKAAERTHCLRGHSLSGRNLIIQNGGRSRACRQCKNDQQRARYAQRPVRELPGATIAEVSSTVIR